ncbi:MAG: hypothetical protein HQK75_14365 [Candidatus Magnetomorum sp.]|nr:hypothetical protein [Candidatus Magnetomorum sp.]
MIEFKKVHSHMMISGIKWISLIVTIMLIPSCLNIQSIYPEKKYYLLETLHPPVPGKVTPRDVLRIAKFRMSPAYTGKGFIYKKSEISYDTDFYNEFLVSPDIMLAEIVRKWFDLSHLFLRVTSSPGHFKEKYILEGAVSAMHGDYSDPKSPMAVLDMQFFLIEDNGLSYALILQKSYRKQIVINKHRTFSLLKGWNQSLTEMLADFQSEISKKIVQ